MLTALTKSGKKICLGDEFNRDALLSLRTREEFVCPVCGEKVTLKLGEHRIFHFAHMKGSECRDFFEPESMYHMEGKLQLYQWLLGQKIAAELEYYDKEIKQRPDIMFIYNGRKYALEYQCSSIPEKILVKRTKTYINKGYSPVWVLGNNHIHLKKKGIVELSSFHYLIIRRAANGSYYLPAYCPEKKLFHLFGSIIPYSVKKTIVNASCYPTKYLRIETLLNPKIDKPANLKLWIKEIENSYLKWSLHRSPEQHSFLKEIYHQCLNPYLLPAEIGLPVQHAFLIKTSPMIWQTYLFIDILAGKKPGDRFTIFQIKKSLEERIARKEIIPRSLPQFPEKTPLLCVLEFFLHLANLGFILHKGEGIFQIQRCFQIPKTNREKEEARKNFIEKNRPILTIP